MKKVDFEVTPKAGTFVAGRRSPGAGKTISLTQEQAYFALRAGELKMPGEPARQKGAAEPDQKLAADGASGDGSEAGSSAAPDTDTKRRSARKS